MDKNELVLGEYYRTTEALKACFYDADECLMPEMVDLPSGTELSYLGPDDDHDGGFVFENDEGTKFCLHDNDLVSIQLS